MRRSLFLLTLSVLTIHQSSSRLHHVKHNHNHQQRKTKGTPAFSLPTGAFVEDASPSPSPSTTAALTLKVGNRTINTNLQSALDDISPGLIGGKTVPDSATYPPNVYNSLYKSGPNPAEAAPGSSNSTSVIFEVLGIDPYTKEHRKLSMRFVLMTSLYGTLGLSCILATYCLLRMIGGRQKRNKQYMLLTKRDLDFPLGGGGI